MFFGGLQKLFNISFNQFFGSGPVAQPGRALDLFKSCAWKRCGS